MARAAKQSSRRQAHGRIDPRLDVFRRTLNTMPGGISIPLAVDTLPSFRRWLRDTRAMYVRYTPLNLGTAFDLVWRPLLPPHAFSYPPTGVVDLVRDGALPILAALNDKAPKALMPLKRYMQLMSTLAGQIADKVPSEYRTTAAYYTFLRMYQIRSSLP